MRDHRVTHEKTRTSDVKCGFLFLFDFGIVDITEFEPLFKEADPGLLQFAQGFFIVSLVDLVFHFGVDDVAICLLP